MSRSLGKPFARVAGVDDGSFRRADRRAPLVGVICAGPSSVEAVLRGSVAVDGTDATDRIARLFEGSPHLEGIRAVVTDGIAFGGFNLLDLGELSSRLGRPVIAVTRRPPDYARIRRALVTYFPRDARRRWSRVRAHRLFRVPTGGAPIWAAAVGCRRAEAAALVRRLAVHGFWPEPLRLARLIARAYARRPAAAPRKPTLKRTTGTPSTGPVA